MTKAYVAVRTESRQPAKPKINIEVITLNQTRQGKYQDHRYRETKKYATSFALTTPRGTELILIASKPLKEEHPTFIYDEGWIRKDVRAIMLDQAFYEVKCAASEVNVKVEVTPGSEGVNETVAIQKAEGTGVAYSWWELIEVDVVIIW